MFFLSYWDYTDVNICFQSANKLLLLLLLYTWFEVFRTLLYVNTSIWGIFVCRELWVNVPAPYLKVLFYFLLLQCSYVNMQEGFAPGSGCSKVA